MRDSKAAGLPRQGSNLVMRLMVAGVVTMAAASAVVPARAEGLRGAGGHHGMMLFGGSPEHVGRAVDRMLDGVDASDAQRSQIKQIATQAAADLESQRAAGRGLRDRGAEVFTAPNVDARDVESLRQQMLAQHDQTSKRVMQALLDVSRVLTPEQRVKIGERIKQHQSALTERTPREPRARPQQ